MVKLEKYQFSKKIEKYINEFKHITEYWINKVTGPYKRLKTLHHRIRQHNVENLPVVTFRNPYHVFSDWLFEIAQYSFTIGFVYAAFSTQTLWMMIVSFGLIRWLWLDIVKNTKQAIE